MIKRNDNPSQLYWIELIGKKTPQFLCHKYKVNINMSASTKQAGFFELNDDWSTGNFPFLISNYLHWRAVKIQKLIGKRIPSAAQLRGVKTRKRVNPPLGHPSRHVYSPVHSTRVLTRGSAATDTSKIQQVTYQISGFRLLPTAILARDCNSRARLSDSIVGPDHLAGPSAKCFICSTFFYLHLKIRWK